MVSLLDVLVLDRLAYDLGNGKTYKGFIPLLAEDSQSISSTEDCYRDKADPLSCVTEGVCALSRNPCAPRQAIRSSQTPSQDAAQ